MEVDLADGAVTKFISFEKLGGGGSTLPLFHAFHGVYHDVRDQDDG
jgi:hypothetical protein